MVASFISDRETNTATVNWSKKNEMSMESVSNCSLTNFQSKVFDRDC